MPCTKSTPGVGSTSSTVLLLYLLIVSFLSSPADLAAQRAELFEAPEIANVDFDGDSFFAPFEGTGRFQQVYDASVFADLPPGGGLIKAFSFRVDAFFGRSFDATIRNIQLNLSTTSRSPDGLSSVFDENTGANDMSVLGPGSMFVGGGGGGGVTGFGDAGFIFVDQPFYYNPADGNLLLDFRINQGIGIVSPPFGVAVFDAFNTVGDSVSSVFGSAPSGSALTSSGQLSSRGLATQFSIVPVPEPSTVALLAVSLGALALGWLQKRNRRRNVGP